MKLETKYQGLIEVSEEQIIAFEKGIPAFESEMSFVLLPFEEGTPFYVLQSTKTPEVAFIVISPFDFVTGYQSNCQTLPLKCWRLNSQMTLLLLSC